MINDKLTSKLPGTATLNLFHIWGMAKRLRCDIEKLPEYFDREETEFLEKRGYDPKNALSSNSATKLLRILNNTLRDKESPRYQNKALLLFIDVVNAEMKKHQENGVIWPSWVKPIDLPWLHSDYPDADSRQHIPDFSVWQKLVNPDLQDKVEHTMSGLWYLYRANAMSKDGTPSIERELVCIHPPAKGHIRIHLINDQGEIHSGLGYVEDRTLTATLFRQHDSGKFRSRRLEILGPETTRESAMDGVITRRIRKTNLPFACKVKLVEIQNNEDPRKKKETFQKISNALYNARLSGENTLQNIAVIGQHFPKTKIPLEDQSVRLFAEDLILNSFRLT